MKNYIKKKKTIAAEYFEEPTQAPVVKSEVFPLFNIAGVKNCVYQVLVLVIVHDAEHGQIVAHQETIPELQDAACGLRCGNHIIPKLLLFVPLYLGCGVVHCHFADPGSSTSAGFHWRKSISTYVGRLCARDYFRMALCDRLADL